MTLYYKCAPHLQIKLTKSIIKFMNNKVQTYKEKKESPHVHVMLYTITAITTCTHHLYQNNTMLHTPSNATHNMHTYIYGSLISLDDYGIGNTIGSCIYNLTNNLKIVERLPRFQNILRFN